MPVRHTREAVLIIGTAIGFAAFCGGAGAETPFPEKPIVLAQGSSGFGSSGISSEIEKKKKEEEQRKHEQGGQKGNHVPPNVHFGTPPVTHQPELRKKDEGLRHGQIDEQLKRDEHLKTQHPDNLITKPPVHMPSGTPPVHQPAPLELRKKDEGLHHGQIDERLKRDEHLKTQHPDNLITKPPVHMPSGTQVHQPTQLELKPGPKGVVLDKPGRTGMGATGSILPKPSVVELETRRKQRQESSRMHLQDISHQRTEHKDASGRIVIVEPGNRRIMKDNGHVFIHHDETDRLRHGARDFREERGSGGERRNYYTRSDGVVIITIVGEDGRMLRRMRREHDGREVILIDNGSERWRRHRGHAIGGFGFFVELAPPVMHISREEYYVYADEASEDDVYDALAAPPIEDIEADYTLDEIRYSPALRARMRTVNLNSINFDFGSWEVTQDQVTRLDVVARAIRAILSRNPDEVFLIGGHTDAVGSDEDNLSLSDRRAESVAQVLTDEFGIPAENLVTQGYGEQYLLLDTQEPERRNRRVEFQRITPLLARQ